MPRTLILTVLAVALTSAACMVPGATTAPTSGNNEFAEARRDALAQAKRGDIDAQFRAATMLAMGQGGPRDEAEAIRWYRAAADQGSAEAKERLGFIYLSGRGNPALDPLAHECLSAAAESGSADTKYRLAVLFSAENKTIEQDLDKALHWMKRAADSWNSPAGIGARLEGDKLVELFAELGLPEAQHQLGLLYSVGQGVPLSKAESARWHKAAAEQGYAQAQFVLARLYSRGDGVSRDIAETARWHLRGAEQGHAASQYQLGLLYRTGSGVPQDDVRAHMWFNLAAAQGHQKAKDQRESLTKTMTSRELTDAERLAIDWEPAE